MKSLKISICSIFQNKYATKPKSINLWEALNTPWQSTLIKRIQSLPYKSAEQQNLKGKLLAITPAVSKLAAVVKNIIFTIVDIWHSTLTA